MRVPIDLEDAVYRDQHPPTSEPLSPKTGRIYFILQSPSELSAVLEGDIRRLRALNAEMLDELKNALSVMEPEWSRCTCGCEDCAYCRIVRVIAKAEAK